jgi:hypothetical protein
MTLSARYDELRRTLSEELQQLPDWKREALRRDEEFVMQRHQELHSSLRTPSQDDDR